MSQQQSSQPNLNDLLCNAYKHLLVDKQQSEQSLRSAQKEENNASRKK